MTFNAYLVKNGIISEEDLNEAMERQRISRVTIGKLAVTQGMLTMKQIFKILGEQAKYRAYEPQKGYKRFGEIAVDLGFMKNEDIEFLLKKQNEDQSSITEILVEMGAIDKEELEMEYADFKDEHGDTTDEE
jgi:hypothetical protein